MNNSKNSTTLKVNNKASLIAAALMIAATLLGFCSSSQANPPGLVSWWQAEGNTLDTEGENNGTAQGTVNYAPGAFGQGFSLEGFSDPGHIDVASPTLNAYDSAFTIAGWFVIDNTSGQPSVLDFRDGSNSTGFTLSQNASGQMDFFIFKDADLGGFTLLQSTGWALDTPYFIAATFDGNSMTIYRDGSPVATNFDAVADTVRNVTNPMLQIGRNVVNGSLWDGQIDEVQFYDRALTQPEVASLLVPEPATTSLMLLAVVSLAGIARRRYRNKA